MRITTITPTSGVLKIAYAKMNARTSPSRTSGVIKYEVIPKAKPKIIVAVVAFTRSPLSTS